MFPYNLGRWHNIRMVLHCRHRPELDGITWPVCDGCHQYTLTVRSLHFTCHLSLVELVNILERKKVKVAHTRYRIIIMIIIRQFIRRRNMSMRSLQGRCTPGSRDECRTAPDDCRPLDQAHGLEPLARL